MERRSYSDGRQYTLQELADSAGVSIRTIRYYIGEGLLPGPEGGGSQSHYTESHRQRLRAISLLKERFLPLKEIRRTLTGLDESDIEQLIIDLGETEPAAETSALAPPSTYGVALDYVDAALAHSPARGTRAPRRRGYDEHGNVAEHWRRIEIADGVELLVREDIYHRRKDQIDWLTDWARKVVD